MISFPTRLGTHAKFLGRMMRACGVNTEQLAHDRLGLTFASVARACMACSATDDCRDWLDAAGADGTHQPPAFCPNAERFRRARAE